MTRVVLILSMPASERPHYSQGLRSAFPELDIKCVANADEAMPFMEEADVLVAFSAAVTQELLGRAKRLRWVQTLGTGTDGIVDSPMIGSGVTVTRVHGIHGVPISEAAIASMLALARRLPATLRNQTAGKWERSASRTLNGSSVLIVGVGSIAETLAPLCKAFGMRVEGLSSSRASVAGFDRIRGRQEFSEAVAAADYVVLLAPATAENHHLVNAETLRCFKKGAFLINLSRGELIDEAALLAGLNEGLLGGAALDVFAAEPLAKDHPFWSRPDVLMTPHSAGAFHGYAAAALPIVIENMQRFLNDDIKSMHHIAR